MLMKHLASFVTVADEFTAASTLNQQNAEQWPTNGGYLNLNRRNDQQKGRTPKQYIGFVCQVCHCQNQNTVIYKILFTITIATISAIIVFIIIGILVVAIPVETLELPLCTQWRTIVRIIGNLTNVAHIMQLKWVLCVFESLSY